MTVVLHLNKGYSRFHLNEHSFLISYKGKSTVGCRKVVEDHGSGTKERPLLREEVE